MTRARARWPATLAVEPLARALEAHGERAGLGFRHEAYLSPRVLRGADLVLAGLPPCLFVHPPADGVRGQRLAELVGQ
jgi:hypothetical protein